MYPSGGVHSTLWSSGWPKESSSGSRPARPGAPARVRSPRSHSPRGHCHRSPSEASRSRPGSEQWDRSLSRQLSLEKHSQATGRRSPNRRSESSEEHSLQTSLGNDYYDIDSLDRRRLIDRLGAPVDGDVGRDDFAECPVYSRQLLCPQSYERYSSPDGSPLGYFNRRYNKDCQSRNVFCKQSDFNMNYDHLQDTPRETDRDGDLLKKSLYLSEESERETNRLRHGGDDRLLDVSMDPQGFLSDKQGYYRQSLGRSPSPAFPDEDFRELEKSWSERNMCQDMLSSSAVTPGLTNPGQSSEPHFFHTPEQAPAVPKKSILKKRVDDLSVQAKYFLTCSNKHTVEESANNEFQPNPDVWRVFSVLKNHALPAEPNSGLYSRQVYHELTPQSADIPHEKANQYGNGFSHIQEKMADCASTQVKRSHSIFEVENEEKFLYDDGETAAIISDGKNPASEMQNVIEEKKKLMMSEQEAQQKKLVYLRAELNRRSQQHLRMLGNRLKEPNEDPLLREVVRVQQDLKKEFAELQLESQRTEIKLKCLNNNPCCKNMKNLEHQGGLFMTQTQYSLKRKKRRKRRGRKRGGKRLNKANKDEKSAKPSSNEESENIKELGEGGNGNEFCKDREVPRGQKIMIKFVLKKDNLEVKKEVEKEESQTESSQSSSEECSLSKTCET